jgi:CheY-like chemotaxis protein
VIASHIVGVESVEILDKKVLVVEDNEVNQMVVKGMLARIGIPFDLANNGQEAMEQWEENSYDLILMDCQMPVMDGYEATQKIRAAESAAERVPARIPIVALSAHSEREESNKCLAVGMDDFLAKPLTIERLKNMVEKWLK